MTSGVDPWAALGLPAGATGEQIRAAYFEREATTYEAGLYERSGLFTPSGGCTCAACRCICRPRKSMRLTRRC